MGELKENKMGTAPITPLVWKMALPAMLSMMVQALYNIVDSMFVAKISQDAFNALSIAFPVQMLMVSICVGTGVGINSLVSRKLGEGRVDEASNAATHGIVLAVFGWIFMFLVGFFLAEPFFRITTQNEQVITYGVLYVKIATGFCFGAFIEVSIEKVLQATGNMILPMLSQLLGCIINIILDPILIFGLIGKPMGIAGAAIATVTGQIVAMLFCIAVILFKSHDVKISFKGFKFSKSVTLMIYEVGIPAIIMQAIASVLITFLNLILITASEVAVNVLGAYYKLQSFVFMPVFGLSQGVMPVMGYNYGAGNKDRLMKALYVGTFGAAAIMLAGTALFWIIPRELLLLFSATDEMIEIGVPALRTISLCFVPAAFGILFSTLFQACGMGMKSLVVSLIRQLICILPAAYLLSKISLGAIWFAFPLAEVVAFIIALVLVIKVYKDRIKNLVSIRNARS